MSQRSEVGHILGESKQSIKNHDWMLRPTHSSKPQLGVVLYLQPSKQWSSGRHLEELTSA